MRGKMRTVRGARRLAVASVLQMMLAPTFAPRAIAAGCALELQGDGIVSDVIDGRTLRLQDGREVRLAGIEAVSTDRDSTDIALKALAAGRKVTLHGENDTPDRYGRQPAFVMLDGADISIQSDLLAQGAALVSAAPVPPGCAGELAAAEAAARRAKRGLWSHAAVIKNAESRDDILAGIGQFIVVEGQVLSVRQAGATTYVNFGRNWTRDFAVTISRRTVAALESSGMPPKSFERRRIRVRGYVAQRGGPRIEVLRAGQIEVVGDN